MKIFGTIFPFVEPNPESSRMGRFVANYEFLAALLNYGDFDSYHLFCLNPQHLQRTVERLTQDASIAPAQKNKIQLFLFTSLTDKLQNEHYHVFHLGGWGYFFAGLAQLRSQYACSPFPITGVIHSLNAREARFDYYKLLKAPIAACDAIVCTSQAGKKVMEKQLARIALQEGCMPYAGELPVIPLAAEPLVPADRDTCRTSLGLPTETVVLLYIGRISPNTKADLYPLLLCFQQLLQHNTKPLQLILAGGASAHQQTQHREMLRELGLESSVTFMPNIEPELKWQLYSAADICVAPSDNLQETFGLSVIEAMLAERPVVAAELNGYRDLIEDGSNGYLIRTTWIDQLAIAGLDEVMANDSLQTLLAQAMVIDLPQLQARLQQLIDDAELRQQLGAAARHKAERQYTWPIVIQQYQQLWQALQQTAQQCQLPALDQHNFSNDYLQAFNHYPTRLLDERLPVTLTASGRQCLASGATPPIYSDVAMLLDQNWLSKVMTALSSGQSEAEMLTVGELLQRFGDHNHRGRFSLLWAAKYGLLHLG